MAQPKKLYRNMENSMILGVCAGLADYFNVDVTLIRIAFVFFAFAAGAALLAYLIAAILMPVRP